MQRTRTVLFLTWIMLGFVCLLFIRPGWAVEVGVNDQEILIGSSLALSGQAGHLGTEYRHGALAYLNFVNDNGGVHGRKIKVLWYDDVYDPPQTIANTRKLIEEDQVFCLFNYVGTQNSMKILPMLENQKIPLLGVLSGSQIFRNPFHRYLFNVRSSYHKEIETVIDHAVKSLGLKRIAIFYQYDAYGMDGRTGAEIALEKNGLAPVAVENYLRGTTDIEEALKNIVISEAELVVMAGVADPCAKFILEGKAIGFNPIYYNVSFVGPDKLVELLGDTGQDEIITLVVPPLENGNAPIPLPQQQLAAPDVQDAVTPPEAEAVLPEGQATAPLAEQESQSLRSLQEYENLLKKYFSVTPSTVGLEGFINAKVLVEALNICGRDITRENFINTLESMNDFDAGIGSNISFGPNDRQGLDNVYVVKIKGGKMLPLVDWGELRK